MGPAVPPAALIEDLPEAPPNGRPADAGGPRVAWKARGLLGHPRSREDNREPRETRISGPAWDLPLISVLGGKYIRHLGRKTSVRERDKGTGWGREGGGREKVPPREESGARTAWDGVCWACDLLPLGRRRTDPGLCSRSDLPLAPTSPAAARSLMSHQLNREIQMPRCQLSLRSLIMQ